MIDAKLNPIKSLEDRAIELLVGEKKTLSETKDILRREGYGEMSLSYLQKIKKRAFDSLVKQYKTESTAEFLLESIKKITLEFEDLYIRFKSLSERFEREDKPLEQLLVLRELRAMLHMALKKLGEYKSGIEKSREANVYITNSDVILMVKEAQERIFSESNPTLENGKIILNNPSAEMIDAFHKWRFKNMLRAPNAANKA